MRILVVHEVDYLKKVIYEYQEFPEMLAGMGHEITVFHFQENINRSTGNRYLKKVVSGRIHPETTLNLVEPHQFGLPILDRLWVTLSCIPALVRLFQNNKFDVVFNYAVPTYGLQLLLLARLFRVPFVHRSIDVSHKIRKGIHQFPTLLVEKIIYRYANLLSSNNLAMKSYCDDLSNRNGISIVNYPPLDLKHFKVSGKDAALISKLKITNDEFVIVYIGSFFYFSGLPEVVDEFANLTSLKSQMKLLLIGGGEQDKVLREKVSNLKLENKVIFTGYIDYDDLPRYLKLADVAINPLESNLVTNTALPNKVLQYLASDLPVVSVELKGLKSIFRNNRAITWCKTPSEVIQQAVKFADIPESILASYYEKQELESILNQFEPTIALKSLEKSLKSIARKN